MSDKVKDDSALMALNMIVGPGEAEELDRCLDSFDARRIFDQIVVVNTSTDQKIDDVATKYGADLHRFQWRSERYPHGNFAGARNMALDNTRTRWVMWLDADDICDPAKQKSLVELRRHISINDDNNVDAFFMQYALITNPDFTAEMTFMRERIFRRSPKFKWRYPCHEQLCADWSTINHAIVKNFNVVHLPAKPSFVSAERNVRILEHEMKTLRRPSPHLRYFYGRDLMVCGRVKEGLEILKAIVRDMENCEENLYAISQDIADLFAYDGHKTRPTLDEMNMENEQQIERWLRMAAACCTLNAEPFVGLGDLYTKQGEHASAIRCYKAALGKKIGTGLRQSVPFYEELPARRLADYMESSNEHEQALWYNMRALKHVPNDAQLIVNRRRYLEDMLIKMDFEPDKDAPVIAG